MRGKSKDVFCEPVHSLQSWLQLTLQYFYDILESSLNHGMTDFHNLSLILFLLDRLPKITLVLLHNTVLCLIHLFYMML